MEAGGENPASKASSLRWRILRRALRPRASTQNPADDETESEIRSVSRKTNKGFNLIPFELMLEDPGTREIRLCYTLPVPGSPKLVLTQRVENCAAELKDFEISNKFNIDNTGIVCQWPSEEVLAYFCLSHSDLFRSKKVIELGSGYGLAGLVIAATTEALEVVISDGNPQVVDS